MVSIIILVQDRYDFFVRCIDSIVKYTTQTPYEFVFVVQGKVDQRILAIINSLNGVVIYNEVNNGVTPGRNQGIQAANGDYLLFFDDDAYVNEDLANIPEKLHALDWLGRLLRYYKNPTVGIVSQSGSFIHPDRWGVFWAAAPEVLCDVGQGYCYMFSRAVVNAIGGLDPYFGKFWHEESEYALRAKHAGFKVANAGYIGVMHLGSGSGDDGTFGQKAKYMHDKWSPYFDQILCYNKQYKCWPLDKVLDEDTRDLQS